MRLNLLFCLFPFRGHTIQALEIIEELNSMGKYKILVDIGQEYFEYLSDDVDKHMCLYKFKTKKYKNHYSKDTLLNYGEGILTTVNRYRKWYENNNFVPDLICFDSLAFWGKILAEENGIPSIALHTIQPFDDETFNNEGYNYLKPYSLSFSCNDEFKRIMHIYSRICIRKYNLYDRFAFSDLISAEGDYNVILVPEYLCKYKDKKNNNIIYNPIIIDSINKKREVTNGTYTKENIIYISTGSIIFEKDFLITCIEQCLELLNFKIYVSAGDYVYELKNRYAEQDRVHIYKFAPQNEILKKAKLFITHGGMNSICESIYNETPMLVIPFVNDEFLNAEMVELNGIGLKGSKDLCGNKISIYLNKILNNTDMYKKITCASKKMKSSDTISLVRQLFDNLLDYN